MPDTLPDATPVAWLNVNQKLHTPNDNQMCITKYKKSAHSSFKQIFIQAFLCFIIKTTRRCACLKRFTHTHSSIVWATPYFACSPLNAEH